jgi:hypothetical protein
MKFSRLSAGSNGCAVKKPTFQRPSLSSASGCLSGYADENRDGLRNVGFSIAQPFDPVDSRENCIILSNKSHYTKICQAFVLMEVTERLQHVS